MTLVERSDGVLARSGPGLSEPVGSPSRPRMPYFDGIRAVAVLAVLCYHGGVPLVGGGLLGVDVFFVLSGFLITGLLVREFTSSARIALGRFWAGRARRLLPALVILLLGVAAYAYFFSGSVDLGEIRGDSLATLFYVANWHYILSDQGYFALSAAPSPLLHTWSLGVEEQYYLIWPLVALVVLRWKGSKALAWVAGVGALCSAGLMAAMAQAGFSADRLYYGTDTRAQALMVGSVLGVLAAQGGSWRVVKKGWAATKWGKVTGALLGAGGAGWLLWAFHAYPGQDSFLYDGGFFLVALGAGAVITAVASWPRGWLALVCSWQPLRLLGRISYGVYLYHWPLFLVLDHAHTGLSGAALFAVRVGVTLVVATVSFRFIEEPIRKGAWFHTWRAAAGAGAAAATAAGVVLLATSVPVSAGTTPSLAGRVGRSSMPAAEVRALAASGAFTSNPVQFELLGDSEALTMDLGLRVRSVHDYGVKVDGGSWLGCDFNSNLPARTAGVAGPPSEVCANWRSAWPRLVDKSHAQVVGILMGRFELLDHYWRGRWVHVGQAVWDRHLEAEVDQAIRLVSAHGARVVIYSAPFVDPPIESRSGGVFPENEPSRVVAYNRVLRAAAARYPGVATVMDLNRVLDPGGRYHATIDGVRVRWSDGIHITKAGGEWLQPRLLPSVAQLGLKVRSATAASAHS